ncbi:MAG TPA: ABC transporter substrate-binding protein [Limnochordales bacterium]|nr:ABC transporter substrate-binding protein [Limnochordales bacterium]
MRTGARVSWWSVVVLVLLLAAATASAQTRIPIGVLLPFTGAGAAEGPFMRNAAELAFEEIHEMLAAGGSDIQFQLVIEDTRTTPEGALAAIESLAAAGVQVVIGPYSSAAASGVRGFADANKILVISASSTSPALAIPNDYLFRLIVSDTLQGAAVSALIDHDGYRQVVVFHRGDSYGAGMANAFKDVFESQYGGTAHLLPYDPDLPDFAAEVQNLAQTVRRLGVDDTAVLLVGFQPDGLNILGHARLDPTLTRVRWYGSKDAFSPVMYPPHAPAEISAFMASVNMTGAFPTPPDSPVRRIFEAKYQERFGHAPSPWALYMYDSAWIAALSVLAAGEYNGEALRNVARVIAARYIGASGHKMLDANDDAAIGDYEIMQAQRVGDTYAPVVIGKWSSGTGELVLHNP